MCVYTWLRQGFAWKEFEQKQVATYLEIFLLCAYWIKRKYRENTVLGSEGSRVETIYQSGFCITKRGKGFLNCLEVAKKDSKNDGLIYKKMRMDRKPL